MDLLSKTGFVAIVISASLTSGTASAQTTANGPYYAVPSWDQTLPANTRFIILNNMQGQAFLDRETGLVWQRQFPDITKLAPSIVCNNAEIGGRHGWRLPSIQELTSLFEPAAPLKSLFVGFPQSTPSTNIFLQSSTYGADDDSFPYYVHWAIQIEGNDPLVIRTIYLTGSGPTYPVCVRGGTGEWRQ